MDEQFERDTKLPLQEENRALRLLSRCGHAFLRAVDEESMLRSAVDIIVAEGGYRFCWVGFVEQDWEKTIRPVVQAGFSVGYLEEVTVTWGDTPNGHGPAGLAASTGLPSVFNDIGSNPGFDPWYKAAHERGYASVASLPLMADSGILGVLSIYAAEVNAFDANELSFLTELATDLGAAVRAQRAHVARARAEASLRETEERFRLLVESVVDCAIVTLNPEGCVATWNAGAEKIQGYRAEEILGEPFSSFYTPEAVQGGLPQVALREAAERGHFEEEGVRIRKDKTRFWADAVVTPLYDDHCSVRGYAVVTRDVTERKRAQEALERYSQELQRSNGELQEFAYVASHDLQEPLRKIQAFGDRLKTRAGESLDEECRDYVQRMQSAASRMSVLISDLLSFSRVTTHARPPARIDLAQVVRDVISDLETRIEETGACIEMGDLPSIEADPLQMRQLFQNLLANALKFHKEGQAPRVKVHGSVPAHGGDLVNETCVLVVEDDGIGFDEKYLERIFTLFQRLHGRDEYEGTGVGLAICRKIAGRHGGTITARSRPGQGAVFTVTLPTKQKEGGNRT